MAVIVINALNSNSGGGKSIRDSYVTLLNAAELQDRYVIVTVVGSGLEFVTNPNIEIIEMPRFWSSAVFAPLIYRFFLGRVFRNIGADVVLNMGDLIVHTAAKQLYIFDWPYALDVHPKVWADMNRFDWINRRLKLWLIQRDFKYPDIVIAQTDFIKSRLTRLYGLKDVRVVNNAVTINTAQTEKELDFSLPRGLRLLYPTVYYPHKNLEVLLELAGLIKLAGRDYQIVTTVNADTKASRRFLGLLKERGLQDIILNVGQVPLNQMQTLYRQCNALLMPTLLESFSIVYLEAMHFGLPVFTSDMWFAHAVCGDAAVFIDPFDPKDMFQSIDKVMSDATLITQLSEAGERRLASFPSWTENFATYQKHIGELLRKSIN